VSITDTGEPSAKPSGQSKQLSSISNLRTENGSLGESDVLRQSTQSKLTPDSTPIQTETDSPSPIQAAPVSNQAGVMTAALVAVPKVRVDIQGPTILAIFPPEPKDPQPKEQGAKTALPEFELRASRISAQLKDQGIQFRRVDAGSFSIRIGKTLTTFESVRGQFGYYFIAPDKEPHAEYGPMSDADLLRTAEEYFGIRRQVSDH
jgi:hypothetical protein